MPRTIQFLGTLTISDDGQPAALLSSAKGCALLAYLIVRGQTEPREHLVDLLWETTSTREGLRNLRVLLSRIRNFLPDVSISRQALTFCLCNGEQVDYLLLREALERPDNQALLISLRIYQGDLLAGFYLDDAPRFQEWLVLERERLRRDVLNAYRRLCQDFAAAKDWQQGVIAATQWVAVDQLDEEAILWLMQFLAADGHAAAALREYEQFRVRLQHELGFDPEPATRELANQLRESYHKAATALFEETDFTTPLAWPSRDTLAPVGLLPAAAVLPFQRNPDFIGRTDILLQLASLLLPWPDDPPNAVPQAAVLSGMGGLGKTQTAVEFCYRYGRYFPGGVFWISFADATNVAEEISQIGGQRGMGLYREADNLRQADKVGRVLKAWQESVPRLLIFDNCEEVALLQKWRPVTGGCSVLLTSRRAYWPPELQMVERVLPVLNADESIRFLQKLVPELTTTNAADIAEELGHLPLALHLAGGYLRRYRQITADQYLAQLRSKTLVQHPSLRGRGTDISPTDHELDIARTFAINWEQLTTTDETDAIALKLLTHAAQFAPGEPIPHDLLLSTVVPDETDLLQTLLAEDGLARLIALSFIRINKAEMLSLHRLVIAFVQTMLPDVAGVQTTVAQTIWQHIKGQGGIGRLLDQLVVPPTHMKFMMEVELAKGTPVGVHLAHAWGRHLLDISDFANSRIYLEKALALCEQVYGTDQLETADVLLDLGTLAWYSGSDQMAWPPYRRAYDIFRHHLGETHFRTGNSLMTFAILYARAGDYDSAIDHYQQALAIFAQVLPPDDPIVGLTLQNLGDTYRRMGQYQVALSHYEEALRMRRKTWSDDHPRILTTLSSVGLVHFLIGEYQAGYDYFLEVYRGRRERLGESHHLTAVSLSNLGVAAGFLSKDEESISYLKSAVELQEKIYGLEHPQLVYALMYLGAILHKIGEMEKGRNLLERALAIQEDKGLENEETAETLTYLATVFTQTGSMKTAYSHLQRAQAIWARRPELRQSRAAATYIGWGEWWERQGNNHTAISYYKQASDILIGQVTETHRSWQQVQAHMARLKDVVSD